MSGWLLHLRRLIAGAQRLNRLWRRLLRKLVLLLVTVSKRLRRLLQLRREGTWNTVRLTLTASSGAQR